METIIQNLIRNEGIVPHLYLDSESVVTVGAGHALFTIDDCLGLPWDRPELVRADWSAVKNAPPGKIASFYASLTRARLTEDQCRQILSGDVKSILLRLGSVFPDWNTYPEPIQVAIADMAFNLGITGLVKKFPSFIAAVKNRNWARASRECHRRGISEERNTKTAEVLAGACGPAPA